MALDPASSRPRLPAGQGPALLPRRRDGLYNPRLHRRYAIRDDIPVMLIDEAIDVDDAEHERLMARVEQRRPRADVSPRDQIGGMVGYAHTMKSGRHTARLLAAAVLVITAGLRHRPWHRCRHRPPPTPLASGGEYHPLTPLRIFDSPSRYDRSTTSRRCGKPIGAPARPSSTSSCSVWAASPPTPLRQRARRRGQHHRRRPALAGTSGVRQGCPAGTRSRSSTSRRARRCPTWRSCGRAPTASWTIALFGPASGTRRRGRRRVRLVLDQQLVPNPGVENDGSRLIPVTPSRVLDSRDGAGTPRLRRLGRQADHRVCSPRRRRVQPGTTDVVPNSPTSPAWCSTSPASTTSAGAATPSCQVLPDAPPRDGSDHLEPQPRAGVRSRPNLVIVPIGADGKVRILQQPGNTHVVVDVVGYLLRQPGPIDRGRPRRARSRRRSGPSTPARPRSARCRSGRAGRGLELRRLRRLGDPRRPAGRATSRGHRQPHLGRPHPAVPDRSS